MSPVESPLVPKSPVDLLRTIDAASIVREWEVFGYDASPFFQDIADINLYRCRQSQLQFYHPCPIGDEQLYAAIGKQPWYYNREKWEFLAAIDAIKRAGLTTVMEVGCGDGKFLRQAALAGLDAAGLDMNAEAVSKAREAGLHASTTTVSEVAAKGVLYDVVCAFQVLEHVADPAAFLADIVRIAKPNGMVILCTPDGDGWLGDRLQLLDVPPHHALRWGRAAYQFLTAILPLHLESIVTEPLTRSQTRAWAIATLDPDPPLKRVVIGRPTPYRKRLFGRCLAALRRYGGEHATTGGQSLMAVFRRSC
jgi:SAM-dependent methyltransferase